MFQTQHSFIERGSKVYIWYDWYKSYLSRISGRTIVARLAARNQVDPKGPQGKQDETAFLNRESLRASSPRSPASSSSSPRSPLPWFPLYIVLRLVLVIVVVRDPKNIHRRVLAATVIYLLLGGNSTEYTHRRTGFQKVEHPATRSLICSYAIIRRAIRMYVHTRACTRSLARGFCRKNVSNAKRRPQARRKRDIVLRVSQRPEELYHLSPL